MTQLTPEALRQLAEVLNTAIEIYQERHQGGLIGPIEYFRIELLSLAARQEKADRLDAEAKQGAANPLVVTGSGQASSGSHDAASVAGAVKVQADITWLHKQAQDNDDQGHEDIARRFRWAAAALETLDKQCKKYGDALLHIAFLDVQMLGGARSVSGVLMEALQTARTAILTKGHAHKRDDEGGGT